MGGCLFDHAFEVECRFNAESGILKLGKGCGAVVFEVSRRYHTALGKLTRLLSE